MDARHQGAEKTASEAQAARRTAEDRARRSVCVTVRLARRLGKGPKETARMLGTSPRTIQSWCRDRRRHARPGLRGRPPERLDRATAQEIRGFLAVVGPGASLATLRGAFPGVPRAALDRERAQFRRGLRREHGCVLRALRWTRPGSVWAMDFTDSPMPIDGVYPKVLLVRDLASGKQLAALPTRHATARTVLDLLGVLFERHGPPLVLKCDNDGAFREAHLRAFVTDHGVLGLYSPPSLPAYNGACEAGVGSLKTRAHHEAARHDRPRAWTSDDIEAARRQANETARPWGHRGPTPDACFVLRAPLQREERRRLWQRYGDEELAERNARGISEIAELGFYDQASIDRVAIARALIKERLLTFRRRRISQPFNSHSRARIT